MARMTGFVFQDEYLERLAKLSDQEVGRLVRSLAQYHATGYEPELTGRESVAFDFIKVDIDKADKAYQTKCNNMRRQEQNANDSNCTQPTAIAHNCKQLPININIKENVINNDNNAHTHETDFGVVDVDPMIVKVQEELNGMTDTHYSELESFRQTLPDELISHAIDSAVGNGVRNWAYVRKVLSNFIRDGIRTVGEAKAHDEKRDQDKAQKPSQKPARTVSAQRYEQRDYDEKDLEERLGVYDIFRKEETE